LANGAAQHVRNQVALLCIGLFPARESWKSQDRTLRFSQAAVSAFFGFFALADSHVQLTALHRRNAPRARSNISLSAMNDMADFYVITLDTISHCASFVNRQQSKLNMDPKANAKYTAEQPLPWATVICKLKCRISSLNLID
jgi:hypothetical protein